MAAYKNYLLERLRTEGFSATVPIQGHFVFLSDIWVPNRKRSKYYLGVNGSRTKPISKSDMRTFLKCWRAGAIKLKNGEFQVNPTITRKINAGRKTKGKTKISFRSK